MITGQTPGIPRRPFAPSDRLDRFAAALRAHPGEWSVWPNKHNEITARVASSRINRGGDRRFTAGEFEAKSRLGVLHVRYVGKRATGAARSRKRAEAAAAANP